MNKKGAIEGLQEMIVPLIAIAILLTVGFLIFAEAKEKVVSVTGVATTYRNESFTGYTTGTYQATTHSTCMTLSCSEVINGTGNNILPTTIYNCSTDGLQMNNATTDWLDAQLNVTYACTNMTIAYNATGQIQNATQDLPGWLPIIVITVIGALLIGLVARFRAK